MASTMLKRTFVFCTMVINIKYIVCKVDKLAWGNLIAHISADDLLSFGVLFEMKL